jgi:hypothetical protein
MTVQVLGIDLGKNSCGLVGLDAAGRVVLRRRLRRDTIPTVVAKYPDCVVAWRPAPALTTSASCWLPRGTRCG